MADRAAQRPRIASRAERLNMPVNVAKQDRLVRAGQWKETMGLLDRLFGKRRSDVAAPLYAAVVMRGRDPHWYLDGGVPDTIDGRFDMIAAVLSLVLLRLEHEPDTAEAGVALTECFIDDMDAQLREQGVGDVGLGKYVGKMVGMLGGRLSAYREGLAASDLRPALLRNLYRGAAPADEAVAHVAAALGQFADRLRTTPADTLIQGQLP